MGDAAKLGADNVRGETGAEEAAIERSDFALVESAAKMRKAAFYTRADQSGFVRFREDSLQGSFDVTVGNAARSQFARDAEASLAPQFCVLIRVVERVAGVVQIFQFAQARNDRRNGFFVFGAAVEVVLHFVDGVGAAHQGAERGGVEFLFGGKLAR